MLWCHAACNRGSGRSRRGHWATSDNPARAPKPGSKASRPRIAQWPSRAGQRRGQQLGGFGRKVRVVALTPGLASREVNLVAAQEPPDILDVNIAQRLGQQRAGPARKPLRGRLIQQLQNPLVGRLRINRLLARPRLVLQPFKAMVGIAMPPKADNPRLDPNFLGDRPGAAPGRRQQNDPSPLQIALQCHRRAATCLKHLAILLRKLDFSCFGYHPDVESRLTLYGKWVLVSFWLILMSG